MRSGWSTDSALGDLHDLYDLHDSISATRPDRTHADSRALIDLGWI